MDTLSPTRLALGALAGSGGAVSDLETHSAPASLRRERFFQNCCLSFVAMFPLGLGIGVLQGGPRGVLTAGMLTVGAAASVAAWWLSRKGRLGLGIDVMCAQLCFIVTFGCTLGGRGSLATFMLLVAMSVGGIHRQAWRLLVDFGMVAVCVGWMVLVLPPFDPLLYPVLSLMLVMMGLITYFGSRVNELNHRDIVHTNQRLVTVNGELEQARARAEAANDAKTVFLATMSHELRTPLNAVLGYTEMVRDELYDDGFDPDEAAHDLAQVQVAGQRLLAHVSRMLDLTRIESGSTVAWSEVQVVDLVEAVAANHGIAADEKGLDLTLSGPDDPAEAVVITDGERLLQIVSDLVDNAIRFTHDGGVEVQVVPSSEGLSVVVQDTGIGIAHGDQAMVFEPFTQVDGSTTRAVGGVGLGLALCRRLAHSVGATLELESEPGAGTKVTVSLPRRPLGLESTDAVTGSTAPGA